MVNVGGVVQSEGDSSSFLIGGIEIGDCARHYKLVRKIYDWGHCLRCTHCGFQPTKSRNQTGSIWVSCILRNALEDHVSWELNRNHTL